MKTGAAPGDEPPFNLRSIGLPVYLPTLLFAIGEGAVLPIVPVIAVALGADLAVAGMIGAMALLGRLLGNIPSGWIVSRFGERTAMIGASACATMGVVVSLIAVVPIALALGVFLTGLATAVFALARHSFLTTAVPLSKRGRALSTLGGVFRFGMLVGPFLAAFVIFVTSDARSALWIMVACCAATVAVLLIMRDPSTGTSTKVMGVSRHPGERPDGLFRTIMQERAVLLRLGCGAAIVGAMRAARVVVIPLWAVSIGIGESETALIVGLAGGLDFLLFYVGGQITDRFGRVWGALPSVIGLSMCFLLLPLTADLPGAVAWFVATAMLLGISNSLGSGLLLTLGSDLAPPREPTRFLGAWRFVSDLGGAAAPLAISGVIAIASLSAASLLMAGIGAAGAIVLGRYIPRFLPREGQAGPP